MTAMEYIRMHLNSDYPDQADKIMAELEKRFSEEQPEMPSAGAFEKLFQDTGAPFFLCALIMGREGIPGAESYVKGLWDEYFPHS